MGRLLARGESANMNKNVYVTTPVRRYDTELRGLLSEPSLIRDAMTRLLVTETAASAADGKLTVKSLASEAGLKRWYLTHSSAAVDRPSATRSTGREIDRSVPKAPHPLSDRQLWYEEIAKLKETHKQDSQPSLRDGRSPKKISTAAKHKCRLR